MHKVIWSRILLSEKVFENTVLAYTSFKWCCVVLQLGLTMFDTQENHTKAPKMNIIRLH